MGDPRPRIRSRRRRRKTRGDAPLELRFEGVTSSSTPNQIHQRVKLVKQLLANAVSDGSRAYGLKLRKSAVIEFVIEAHASVKKRISTPIDGKVDSTESASFSRDEAWLVTAEKAEKVLNAMMTYSRFADSIRRLHRRLSEGDESVLDRLPRNHPSVYFSRFIRPVFGPQYKDLFEGMQAVHNARQRQAGIEAVSVAVEAAMPPVAEVMEEVTDALNAEEAQTPQ